MKTTNKIMLAALILLLLLLTSLMIYVRVNLKMGPLTEGSMNVVTETRQIASFKAIEARGGLTVELRQDEEIGLTIEADDNLLELVVTEVDEEVLKIHLKERVGKHKAIDVKVSFVTLEALRASAGARVTSVNTLVGLALEHVLSSGAFSDLNLEFETLNLEATAGAHAKLAGKVTEFFIKSNAGSEVDAKDLQAENATINTSSGAVNHIFVNNEMSIDASSGAMVSYGGQPVNKSIETSSGAEVKSL
ncbi:MAG: head GIN domain-containing protein [Bacteroides sp.]|jgi:hypothetical protein|nr:head GIN domain-containing protein [Bacteroides sp.]